MVRKGGIMKLYPGKAQEYERRHALLWPELIEAIRRDGGKNYTIFRLFLFYISKRLLFVAFHFIFFI